MAMSCRGSDTTTHAEGAAVRVVVRPQYMPSFQIANGGEFCFAYNITIENIGETAVRLLSRRWLITDGDNEQRRVEGEGVVGDQPHIAPGSQYQYTSYVDFSTPIGCMQGAYVMALNDGTTFEADIDVFSMSLPQSFN